jgi:hypothetical protein
MRIFALLFRVSMDRHKIGAARDLKGLVRLGFDPGRSLGVKMVYVNSMNPAKLPQAGLHHRCPGHGMAEISACHRPIQLIG